MRTVRCNVLHVKWLIMTFVYHNTKPFLIFCNLIFCGFFIVLHFLFMLLDVCLLQREINNDGDFKGFSGSWRGLALDTENQSDTFLGGFQTFPHLCLIHLAQMLPKYSLFSTPNVMDMKFACLGMHCDVKDCIQLVKQIRCAVTPG